MKKVLIINSSIRTKTTYSILKKLECFMDHIEVDFVNIKDFTIKPCVGCENCIRNGDCHIDDEADLILNKMEEADGIIIGTPVYLRQISGYLKLLIDRGCSWYHRSPLIGKPIFFVTSTQASGSKQSIKYLNDLSTQWGTINTGYVSKTMFNIDNHVKYDILDKFIYFLNDKHKKMYKPKLKEIIEFNTQKVLAQSVLPLDLEHWTTKGYIDRSYFYDCKINIFSLFIGFLYHKILFYFINKNKKE